MAMFKPSRLFLPLALLLSTLLTTACANVQRASVVRPGTAPATAPNPTSDLEVNAPSAHQASAKPETQGTSERQQYAATADLEEQISPSPAVHIGTLENGLRFYIRPNSKPEKRAQLQLVVNAGSVLEDDDQRGLAHFVEHMAFNGTRHFAKQELIDYLERIGSRFGADLNAYTGFDETVYLLKIPTDDAEIVDTAFKILADWAHGISFDPEEVEKERGVILEEWRLGRGARARMRDKQLPVIFHGSRYAERLPIGLPEIIEKAPVETLKRFYRDWYRPDLMAVVAVGDFSPQRIEELIRTNFEPIPKAESPRAREDFPIPPHEKTLFSLDTDPEQTSTSVSIFTKHPVEPKGTYGAYRQALVESMYHSMLNDRLSELSRSGDPPYLAAFSSVSGFTRSATVYAQSVRPREGEIDRGLETLLTEAERVERHGFTASELERAKINILRSFEQTYKERDKIQSSVLASEFRRHYLEQEAIPGIDVELSLAKRFLPTITLDEVHQLAQRWISDENRVILVSAPEKEGLKLPTEEGLLAHFQTVKGLDIEPFIDRTLDAPLLDAAPNPARVVEEKTFDAVGVTEWILENGVRVVLKPTDFQNDQVTLTAFSPGGHSLVNDETHPSATFATAILSESGLGKFGKIELEKALAGKVASVQAYISELEEGVSGFASPQDLETLFQLLYLRFTQPRLAQEAYDSLISRLRILIQNREKNPGTVYQDRLTYELSQGHHRRRPLSVEMLAEVDPEASLDIYRDRFADAGDFTFILVGNFDVEEIRPLVRTYLGGLPTIGRQESWRDVGIQRPEGVVKFEVREGLEPKSQVNLIFHGDAEWSREGLHEIRTLARVLEIRLREILREDLGATYGVGVGGNLSSRPNHRYSFSISFGCSPDQVDSLVERIFQELKEVRADGLNPEDLEKVQESQRRKREVDFRENSFWLRALETYYTYGFDLRHLETYEELVQGVTPENLRQAANRYLNPDQYVLGTLRPETDPAASAEAESGATSDSTKR